MNNVLTCKDINILTIMLAHIHIFDQLLHIQCWQYSTVGEQEKYNFNYTVTNLFIKIYLTIVMFRPTPHIFGIYILFLNKTGQAPQFIASYSFLQRVNYREQVCNH